KMDYSDTTSDPYTPWRDKLIYTGCTEFTRNYRKCRPYLNNMFSSSGYDGWHNPYNDYGGRKPDQQHETSQTYTRELTNPYSSILPVAPTKSDAQIESERLSWWVHSVLLPIALVLMALCFILGVILIVKSYMMTKLRQSILTAMRRRRQSVHAPENSYVDPGDMRASQLQHREDDGRAYPPPEVLRAARERASQIRRH
ncbi:hypothetical protein Ocin01_15646, partial [Orchesella cincta]